MLDTSVRSRHPLATLNLETSVFSVLPDECPSLPVNKLGSWRVLAATRSHVLVTVSAPNVPAFLMLGVFTPDATSVAQWTSLVKPKFFHGLVSIFSFCFFLFVNSFVNDHDRSVFGRATRTGK